MITLQYILEFFDVPIGGYSEDVLNKEIENLPVKTITNPEAEVMKNNTQNVFHSVKNFFSPSVAHASQLDTSANSDPEINNLRSRMNAHMN